MVSVHVTNLKVYCRRY